MAEITVSKDTSIVNENKPIHIEFIAENTPAVLSTDVALRFMKKHKHVLDEIRKIHAICPKSFCGPNFRPVEYVDSKGEKRPAYLLTRDAFSLLVMGFTGSAAIRWKIKYIEAFNALEAAVLQNHAELAHESGYAQGLAEAQSYPGIKVATRRAYLEGLTEGQRLQKRKDGLDTLERALSYLAKGVNMADAAKLVNVPSSTLRGRLRRLRRGLSGVQA